MIMLNHAKHELRTEIKRVSLQLWPETGRPSERKDAKITI